MEEGDQGHDLRLAQPALSTSRTCCPCTATAHLKLDELITQHLHARRDQRRLPGHARRQEHPRRDRLRLTCSSRRDLLDRLRRRVVGRRRELEIVVAALAAGRHILLEGPPGTGQVDAAAGGRRRAGHRLRVRRGQRRADAGAPRRPLRPGAGAGRGLQPGRSSSTARCVAALRDGSLLYVEEINRIPEETLNVLITVMSEAELHVPRLGRVEAAPGFRLVAAMNPFDAVGTARISAAVYDRTCRLLMDYQDAADEAPSWPGRPGRRRPTRRGWRRWSSSCGCTRTPPRAAHRLVGAGRHRHGAGGDVASARLRGRPPDDRGRPRRRARRALGPGAGPRGRGPHVRGRHPRAVRPSLRPDGQGDAGKG